MCIMFSTSCKLPMLKTSQRIAWWCSIFNIRNYLVEFISNGWEPPKNLFPMLKLSPNKDKRAISYSMLGSIWYLFHAPKYFINLDYKSQHKLIGNSCFESRIFFSKHSLAYLFLNLLCVKLSYQNITMFHDSSCSYINWWSATCWCFWNKGSWRTPYASCWWSRYSIHDMYRQVAVSPSLPP